jgi:hypothetical protein
MDITRKLAIFIVLAVPAIIGGVITFTLSGSYTPVFVYEIILMLIGLGLISK